MTKQKSKIISKHPIQRRTTFKKHTKKYVKVYAPYLPAIIGLIIGGFMLLPKSGPANPVLGYATSTSQETLLSETNELRTKNNAGKLRLNTSLSVAAQMKAQDMAKRNYWSHVTPDGKQPWYFVEKAGYEYSQAAENLAYGFRSSKDTVNGWMNSPSHRKAMLNDSLYDVGFGIANSTDYQKQGPETIVVAIYAKSASPAQAKVNSSFGSQPASTISFGQIMTGGNSPWINLIAGIAIGVIGMYLFTKHSLKLRRKIKQGENYILGHPVLDISLLAVLVLLLALSRTAGFIH